MQLPPELTLQIFLYLDFHSILRAAAVSKSWRQLALESQLWICLFRREGWPVNRDALQRFHEDQMRPRTTDQERNLPMNVRKCSPDNAIEVSPLSSLYTRLNNGALKLNWRNIFQQRLKLERNWIRAKFRNFHLPRPNFPWEGHQQLVYAIQFSGGWLVSGSRDKTVKVWNIESCRLRYTLYGHTKSVTCVQFDPSKDEDVIFSGGSDRKIIVWRFSTGQKIHEIVDAHHDSVLNLRFNRSFLVTCSIDKTIKVFARRHLNVADPNYPRINSESHRNAIIPSYVINVSDHPQTPWPSPPPVSLKPYTLLMTLVGHRRAVNAIRIRNDEIISASGDRQIRIWDIHTGQCRRIITGHAKGVTCIDVTSELVLCGGSQDGLHIFNYQTDTLEAKLQGHYSLVRTLQARLAEDSFSDGKEDREQQQEQQLQPARPWRWDRIVSGSYDETIIIWKRDASTGEWVNAQRLSHVAAAMSAHDPVAQSHPQYHTPTHRQLHQHDDVIENQAIDRPVSKLRIFNLQFDARRLIVASQDPSIVGWDFAGGDGDIEEASKFF